MFKRTKISSCALLALGGALLVPALPAFAQQRIEITGSSIKRIDAETALPVTVFKREDIDKTGATNVQEFVDRLTANNGGGRSLGESIGESSAPGQTGASLRNLGRERTLILLNGRRLSAYPFSGLGVDLNAIPLSAIDRIELLRDGASAVYGSDAIGGVINFITRRDFKGGEVTASIEQPTAAGGGGQVGASVAFGAGDLAKDRWNLLGTINVQKYDPLKAAGRDFAKTGNRPDLGIVRDSGNTFPANVRIANAGGTAGTGPRLQIPGGPPNCVPPDSFPNPSASQCRYDFSSKIDIYPASERFGALGKATFQLDADNTLFAEYAYSRNDLTFGISQTPTVTTGKPVYLFPGTTGVGATATLSRFYPVAAVDAVRPGYRGPLQISWRIVDGGQRIDNIINETSRYVFGAEGTLAGWDYKTAFMFAQAKASDIAPSGQFSDTRLRAALATGLVNPFGPNDATGLATLLTAQLTGVELRKSKTSNTGIDAHISREVFKLPGGSAAVAVGFEVRKEKYDDGYSAIAGSGDIVGGSGNAGAVLGQRDIRGLFAELTLPLFKGFELGAAVRNDNYSGVTGSSRDGAFSSPSSSATSPKLSMRFQPLPAVLVRASTGKGFRAPALDNLYAPSSFTNTGAQFNDPFYNANVLPCTDPNADGNFCNAQLTAQNNSNPNLKPEKSKQTSIGLVLEPAKDLSFSIDYFDIKITNGISALTGDDILNDWYAKQTGPTTSSSIYANRLIVDPTTGTLDYVRGSLENLAQARVAGFDVSVRYKFRTGIGAISPSWEATRLTKSTTTNVVSGITSDNLGLYARGGPAIKLKQVFGVELDTGAWVISTRMSKQSGYVDYQDLGNVPSYTLTDLQVQYKAIKNFSLTAGVKNLFNKKPPVSLSDDYFQVGYDPTYADVKLRTLYLRGSYKF